MNALHDLPGAAQAVFKAAAVFVLPAVVEAHGHLVQQVALVHGVNLHAVIAAGLGDGGGLDHVGDLALDLLHGQGGGLHFRVASHRVL